MSFDISLVLKNTFINERNSGIIGNLYHAFSYLYVFRFWFFQLNGVRRENIGILFPNFKLILFSIFFFFLNSLFFCTNNGFIGNFLTNLITSVTFIRLEQCLLYNNNDANYSNRINCKDYSSTLSGHSSFMNY